MRVRFWLLGLAAIPLLLIAACAPPPELRDAKLLQDDTLTTNQPCAAPCWRGITPGQTSWREALTIIEDDATLENLQITEAEDSSAVVAEFQQVGGVACCQMYSETGETVDIIFLRTAPTMTLGEVISAQGEPEYVIGSPFSDNQAIMNVLYPDLPLVVYAFVEGTSGTLSETSEIIGILYLKPSDMELLLQTSNLHAWEGYQSYQAYESGEFEVTPSVTLTPTPSDG